MKKITKLFQKDKDAHWCILFLWNFVALSIQQNQLKCLQKSVLIFT
jgi:hypothetical protein